MFFLSKH